MQPRHITKQKADSYLRLGLNIKNMSTVSGRTIYGALSITTPTADWKPFVASWMVILPVVPILLAVFCLRRIILATLHRHKKLSRRSKNLHIQLLRALTLQACLPVFYVAGVAVYCAEQLDIWHNVWLEYGLFNLFSIIPCISPLLPLYFDTSYRLFLNGLLPAKKEDLERSSGTVNTSHSNHLLPSA